MIVKSFDAFVTVIVVRYKSLQSRVYYGSQFQLIQILTVFLMFLGYGFLRSLRDLIEAPSPDEGTGTH